MKSIQVLFKRPITPSAVYHLLHEKQKYNIGGKIFGVALPTRDWVDCKTPHQIRKMFPAHRSLVAFQCRNPIHRAHAAMFLQVSKENDADILVHPIVGPTKSDDFHAKARHLTYEALKPILKDYGVSIEYLPYNMMVGGPRECLQHLIIRKNFGCTHMIVGRDHAGCKNKSGTDYYGPYDAQNFVNNLQEELGMKTMPFKHMVYVPEKLNYFSMDEAKKHHWETKDISGTEFRRRIKHGENVPEWFAFPQVVEILIEFYGPKVGEVKKDQSESREFKTSGELKKSGFNKIEFKLKQSGELKRSDDSQNSELRSSGEHRKSF